MTDPLSEVDDATLFRAIELRPHEKILARAGTVAGVAAAIYVFSRIHGHLAIDDSSAGAFLASLLIELARIFAKVVFALLAGALAAAPFGWIAGRRRRPMRRELEKRYLFAPDAEYERAGGEAVMLMDRVLPHGERRVVHVELDSGRFVSKRRAHATRVEDAKEKLSVVTGVTDPNELRALLAEGLPSGESLPAVDGHRATIVWFRPGQPPLRAHFVVHAEAPRLYLKLDALHGDASGKS